MLKKIPLRIRFTLVASLFLLVSCTVLVLCFQSSARRMVQPYHLIPASQAEAEDFAALSPAQDSSYQTFQRQTILAAAIIVVSGSLLTYVCAGYVLRPIRNLSRQVQSRSIQDLDKPIDLPEWDDEIRQLTIAFNKMLSDLHQSYQTQKEFSANAAHELRTPLSIMRTKLDVFAMTQGGDPEMRHMVKILDGQLQRLNKLIEDLLWFSQDLPLGRNAPVVLDVLCQDVMEELSPLALAKNITFRLLGEPCTVLGQDSLLERVFYNLLENAVKYSPADTVVTVTLNREGGAVLAQVADQGDGIPEACRQAVFQPFFRVDRSRSRSIGGNGLGLAVCQKILQRHGAAIQCLPNHPQGTIFQITFPEGD